MNFCSHCGNKVILRIPAGDNRERHVCVHCESIHYQNPRIIAGCLPVHEDRVLLCKRAIEPRYGKWTLPAGFMENGETAEQAALRETVEEANARASIVSIYTLFSLPHISQVYMFYMAKLLDLDYSAGEESLEVELFTENDIPWNELSFPVVVQTLEHYFEDRKKGDYPVRSKNIVYPPRRAVKN